MNFQPRSLLGTVPITLLTRWNGGEARKKSCVFWEELKVSQQREHGEHGNGKKMALFIDSTHFAGAFCLKKPFLNILHASFVLVSLNLLCHVLHVWTV